MKQDDDQSSFADMQNTGQPYRSRHHLSITADSKSVSEITIQNRKPVSSTYKAIRTMQAAGFVVIDEVFIDDGGKHTALYKNKVKSL